MNGRRLSDDTGTEGFSLIDMLVALVLLSVVAGLIAAFVGQFRTISRQQTDIAAQSEIDALSSYLESAIGNAMPMALIESEPNKRLYFEGSASSIRFVSITRQGATSHGLRETTIELEGEALQKALVQHFQPRRLDPAARTEATTSVVLADGISELQFQYLQYEPDTFAPLWMDDWTDKTGLPAAVRVTVRAERNRRTVVGEGYAILKLSTEQLASKGHQQP